LTTNHKPLKPTTPEQRHLVATLAAAQHNRSNIARLSQLSVWMVNRIMEEPETLKLIEQKVRGFEALKRVPSPMDLIIRDTMDGINLSDAIVIRTGGTQ